MLAGAFAGIAVSGGFLHRPWNGTTAADMHGSGTYCHVPGGFDEGEHIPAFFFLSLFFSRSVSIARGILTWFCADTNAGHKLGRHNLHRHIECPLYDITDRRLQDVMAWHEQRCGWSG